MTEAQAEDSRDQLRDTAPEAASDRLWNASLAGSAPSSLNAGVERSSRGATAAASQVKLRSRPPESHTPFSDEIPMNSLEFGDPETAAGFTLPPADTGFGAWSYAAAAFAMYIVVWGNSGAIFSQLRTRC